MKLVEKRDKSGNLLREFKVISEAKKVIGWKLPKTDIYDDIRHLSVPIRSLIKEVITFDNIYGEYPSDEITATAYCDDMDEFNEKRGVEIANAKLDYKDHKRMAHQYRRIINTLRKTIRAAEELELKHYMKYKAIEDDMVRTYGRLPHVYETGIETVDIDTANVMAIDIGVDNLASCITTLGISFILDGRKLKSINQGWNKEKSTSPVDCRQTENEAHC